MILSLDVANLAGLLGIEVSERDTALTRVASSDLGAVIDEIAGLDPKSLVGADHTAFSKQNRIQFSRRRNRGTTTARRPARQSRG